MQPDEADDFIDEMIRTTPRPVFKHAGDTLHEPVHRLFAAFPDPWRGTIFSTFLLVSVTVDVLAIPDIKEQVKARFAKLQADSGVPGVWDQQFDEIWNIVMELNHLHFEALRDAWWVRQEHRFEHMARAGVASHYADYFRQMAPHVKKIMQATSPEEIKEPMAAVAKINEYAAALWDAAPDPQTPLQ